MISHIVHAQTALNEVAVFWPVASPFVTLSGFGSSEPAAGRYIGD